MSLSTLPPELKLQILYHAATSFEYRDYYPSPLEKDLPIALRSFLYLSSINQSFRSLYLSNKSRFQRTFLQHVFGENYKWPIAIASLVRKTIIWTADLDYRSFRIGDEHLDEAADELLVVFEWEDREILESMMFDRGLFRAAARVNHYWDERGEREKDDELYWKTKDMEESSFYYWTAMSLHTGSLKQKEGAFLSMQEELSTTDSQFGSALLDLLNLSYIPERIFYPDPDPESDPQPQSEETSNTINSNPSQNVCLTGQIWSPAIDDRVFEDFYMCGAPRGSFSRQIGDRYNYLSGTSTKFPAALGLYWLLFRFESGLGRMRDWEVMAQDHAEEIAEEYAEEYITRREAD